MKSKSQTGHGTRPHPLWMRLLTLFCMALLGVASTVQVCHSHDDTVQFGTLNPASAAASHAPAGLPDSPDSNSAVRCPLCVAMHSALPVTHTLIQVAALRLEPAPITTIGIARLLLWRSDLASRPPPAPQPNA